MRKGLLTLMLSTVVFSMSASAVVVDQFKCWMGLESRSSVQTFGNQMVIDVARKPAPPETYWNDERVLVTVSKAQMKVGIQHDRQSMIGGVYHLTYAHAIEVR